MIETNQHSTKPTMTLPARNTLAVLGAGPIGVEAALAAIESGFDVHVFEQGEVGSHPLAWGHVRMFTPWRMNVGPAARAHLTATGWTPPEDDECPTGRDLAQRLLQPVAALPELAGRIHTHAQVVWVSRRGALKGDLVNDPARREHPFRLLVRDAGGRENFLHAFALIDATGSFMLPAWAGDGGFPARGELHLRPQMHVHAPDVLGLARGAFAGRRTLVIGSGASAATTIAALAQLADESPGTRAVWATRRPAEALFADRGADPLPQRRALSERARAIAGGASAAIAHAGGVVVEGFEFNSATHRYRAALIAGDSVRVEEVDEVVVHTGFLPDDTLWRELQVHQCWETSAPMKTAAALQGATDCLDAPALGADALANPEPDFYVLGAKSYGRGSHFLLAAGYRQVAEALDALARGLATPLAR